MQKNHKQHHNDPWEQEHYQTGDTNPPGKGGGIMAFVLVVVILAVGIARTLNVLNLRMLEDIAQNGAGSETISLFPDASVESLTSTDASRGVGIEKLDLAGDTVSDFDRRYYHMPQGVQVTEVAQNGSACAAGIRAGDVILSVEERPIASREDLEQLLTDYPVGTQVRIEFYRPQTAKIITVVLTLS